MQLDRDDTDSFGPETTTIDNQKDGVYRFYVHDYTNKDSASSNNLSLSCAEVRVLRGSNLVAVFTVPSNEEGTVWTVFEMEGNKITPINNLSYQSSPDNVGNMRMLISDSEEYFVNNSVEEDTWLLYDLPDKDKTHE